MFQTRTIQYKFTWEGQVIIFLHYRTMFVHFLLRRRLVFLLACLLWMCACVVLRECHYWCVYVEVLVCFFIALDSSNEVGSGEGVVFFSSRAEEHQCVNHRLTANSYRFRKATFSHTFTIGILWPMVNLLPLLGRLSRTNSWGSQSVMKQTKRAAWCKSASMSESEFVACINR